MRPVALFGKRACPSLSSAAIIECFIADGAIPEVSFVITTLPYFKLTRASPVGTGSPDFHVPVVRDGWIHFVQIVDIPAAPQIGVNESAAFGSLRVGTPTNLGMGKRSAERNNIRFNRSNGLTQNMTTPIGAVDELEIGKSQNLPASEHKFILPLKLLTELRWFEFSGMGMKTVKFYGNATSVPCAHGKIKTIIAGRKAYRILPGKKVPLNGLCQHIPTKETFDRAATNVGSAADAVAGERSVFSADFLFPFLVGSLSFWRLHAACQRSRFFLRFRAFRRSRGIAVVRALLFDFFDFLEKEYGGDTYDKA